MSTTALQNSIDVTATVQFAKLGLGVAASNNQLSINGKVSIGYGDTSAPSNGLIVSGKVGFGASSAPNAGLDMGALGIAINDGFSNNTVRPSISAAVGNYEIRGYSGSAFSQNDGFLRLSAGGGFNAANQSYIDLSGFSSQTDMNQNIVFGTASTEHMRIDGSGNIIVNTAAVSTSATDGFLYISSCAGSKTDTPTSYTGRVPMVYDTTNNKLWIYNGTWKSSTFT